MFEALLTNRTVSVLVEALPRILTAGLTMTIPLTLLSFFFAMLTTICPRVCAKRATPSRTASVA